MGCLVAILNADGAPVDEPLLRTMMDVAPYERALDHQVWTDGSVGLGFSDLRTEHRPSDTAQPFSVDERLWAVMDGRLDDRATLVRGLERQVGRDLLSASDVELALAAYETWGTGCARHLIGDFAFCVWDTDRRLLFCARDHFGVKPMYYASFGGTLVVSNVLRSLRRHPAVSDRLNDSAIGDFLLFGLCLEPSQTSFADVARLPPAHTLSLSASSGAPHVERYWTLRPGDEVRYTEPQEYVERFSAMFEAAVSDRLRGGPVGILMSGGMDSSAIATTAAGVLGSAAPTALRAFTAVYDTVAEDEERRYSSIVAQALRIEVEHVAVDAYRWFDRWNGDALPPEPSSEPMTAMMADLLERASRHGAVVLTGDGGDPMLLPSTVVSQLGRVPLGILVTDLWHSIWRVGALPPLGVRSALRGWLRPSTRGIPGWLAETLLKDFDARARWKAIGARRAPADRPRGAALSDIRDPWWTSTFETHDPGATQRPVELRYPFFDVRLVSLALTLPSYPWCVNKEILRRAMRGRLPEEVRVRPKSPLAADATAVHGRWTVPQAARAIEAVPAMARYVDVRKFESMVSAEKVLTDAAPGTLAAVALATWLRQAAASRVAA
jgi:asparagine synthase (glutamine-hydrolysing)